MNMSDIKLNDKEFDDHDLAMEVLSQRCENAIEVDSHYDGFGYEWGSRYESLWDLAMGHVRAVGKGNPSNEVSKRRRQQRSRDDMAP
jgi:hypothetical protein